MTHKLTFKENLWRLRTHVRD